MSRVFSLIYCGVSSVVMVCSACGATPDGTSGNPQPCVATSECQNLTPHLNSLGVEDRAATCLSGACRFVYACDVKTGYSYADDGSGGDECIVDGLGITDIDGRPITTVGYGLPYPTCDVDRFSVYVNGKYSLENYSVDVPILAPSPNLPGGREYCVGVKERTFVSTGERFIGAPARGVRFRRCSGFLMGVLRSANEEVPCTPGSITILEEPATPAAGR